MARDDEKWFVEYLHTVNWSKIYFHENLNLCDIFFIQYQLEHISHSARYENNYIK